MAAHCHQQAVAALVHGSDTRVLRSHHRLIRERHRATPKAAIDVPNTRYRAQARDAGPASTTISTAIQPISSTPTAIAAWGAIANPRRVTAAARSGATPITEKRTIPGTR